MCIVTIIIGIIIGLFVWKMFQDRQDDSKSQTPTPVKKNRFTLKDLQDQYSYAIRVVKVNEFDAVVTADYNPDRVNVAVNIFGIASLVPWTEQQARNISMQYPQQCEIVSLTRG